jgi:hypothetical protein
VQRLGRAPKRAPNDESGAVRTGAERTRSAEELDVNRASAQFSRRISSVVRSATARGGACGAASRPRPKPTPCAASRASGTAAKPSRATGPRRIASSEPLDPHAGDRHDRLHAVLSTSSRRGPRRVATLSSSILVLSTSASRPGHAARRARLAPQKRTSVVFRSARRAPAIK